MSIVLLSIVQRPPSSTPVKCSRTCWSRNGQTSQHASCLTHSCQNDRNKNWQAVRWERQRPINGKKNQRKSIDGLPRGVFCITSTNSSVMRVCGVTVHYSHSWLSQVVRNHHRCESTLLGRDNSFIVRTGIDSVCVMFLSRTMWLAFWKSSIGLVECIYYSREKAGSGTDGVSFALQGFWGFR